MQYFREKPLCLCIFIMLCGFSLFSFDHLVMSFILAGAILLCVLSFLVFRIIKKQAAFGIVLTVLFLISACLSFVYFRLSRQIPQEYNATVEGEIIEISDKEYGRQLTIKCTSINSESVPNLKISVYTSDKTTKLSILDVIRCQMDIEPLYGNTGDFASYSFSKGIVGSGEIIDEITVISHNEKLLSEFLNNIRSSFHSFIIQAFGEKGGGLFLALIIGDKDALSDQCALDFSRIGISHMLALSGQHLTILALLIHLILGACGVNKKWRLGILAVFTVCYMTLTGFPPSVVRAGLMLILSCLYFLLGKPHDVSTGLFISVFLFVLISPYAITDTSLLLSAFATFGVIRAIDYTSGDQTKIPKILSPIVVSVLTSLFAMLYTSIITVRTFYFTSILSPLSTLIFSILVQIYIYAGLILSIVALFCNVVPIAEFLYKIIAAPADFIASWNVGYYSTRFTITQILSIVLILLILVFLILKIKHKRIFASLIACVFLGMYLSAMIGTQAAMHTEDIFYSSSEKTEQVYILDEGNLTVLDFSPYHIAGGFQTYQTLLENHFPHIDNYILLGYSKSTVQSLEVLIKTTKINQIYLPTPKSAEERKIFNQLLSAATDATTNYCTYTEENRLALGNLDLYIIELRNQNGFAPLISLSYHENQFTYLAKGSMREDNITLINALFKESDGLIFGKKGTNTSGAIEEIDSIGNRVQTLIHANESLLLNLLPTHELDYFKCISKIVDKKSILK